MWRRGRRRGRRFLGPASITLADRILPPSAASASCGIGRRRLAFMSFAPTSKRGARAKYFSTSGPASSRSIRAMRRRRKRPTFSQACRPAEMVGQAGSSAVNGRFPAFLGGSAPCAWGSRQSGAGWRFGPFGGASRPSAPRGGLSLPLDPLPQRLEALVRVQVSPANSNSLISPESSQSRANRL